MEKGLRCGYSGHQRLPYIESKHIKRKRGRGQEEKEQGEVPSRVAPPCEGRPWVTYMYHSNTNSLLF